MFQQDYILRQIEMMGKLVAKLLHMEAPSEIFEEIILGDGVVCEEQYIRFTVMDLLAKGEVNAAEDLLFEAVEAHPHAEYFNVALEFYGELAKWSEDELKERDFSYREIQDGLEEIQNMIEKQRGGEA